MYHIIVYVLWVLIWLVYVLYFSLFLFLSFSCLVAQTTFWLFYSCCMFAHFITMFHASCFMLIPWPCHVLTGVAQSPTPHIFQSSLLHTQLKGKGSSAGFVPVSSAPHGDGSSDSSGSLQTATSPPQPLISHTLGTILPRPQPQTTPPEVSPGAPSIFLTPVFHCHVLHLVPMNFCHFLFLWAFSILMRVHLSSFSSCFV